MTLEELIGELQTLALAYPSSTPVLVRYSRFSEEKTSISSILIESDSTVRIILDGV
jgi:hypothetical protein